MNIAELSPQPDPNPNPNWGGWGGFKACAWCPAYANDPHTIFEIFSPLSKKIELQGHIVT